jgi:hypothetical protein
MLLSEIKPLYEWVNDTNYLYHGTSPESALMIINSGHIKDFTQSRIDNTKTGVSLTRNPRYAQTGSDDAGRRSSKIGGETIGTDVVFVFNSNILNNMKKKYTVAQSMGKNYNDTMTKGTAQTEYEEFVHGSLPLDKRYGYIGFYINNPNMDKNLKYQLSQLSGYMFRSPQQASKNIAQDKLKSKKLAQSNQQAQTIQQPAYKDDFEDEWNNRMKNKQQSKPLVKKSFLQRLMGK